MKRGLLDGLVKSTVDGLSAPYRQFYLDSWIAVKYFLWKLNNGKEPQVIDFIKRVVVKKVISDYVITETSIKIKKKTGIQLDQKMWNEFFSKLNTKSIGDPLGLTPNSPDEFDDAHLKIAGKLDSCIIITGDKDLIAKNPDIVWFYGKVRKVHSNL